MTLLLNSSLSDNFSLGEIEKYLPRDQSLLNRIIRFKPVLGETSDFDIEKFFLNCKTLGKVQGREASALGEFLLERFLFEAQLKASFNRVRYIEENPGTIIKKGKFQYEFGDNGRSITIYNHDKSQTVTSIARLVEITKGRERNFVICHPKISRDLKANMLQKVICAKELIGEGDYSLCCMMAYSSDIFRSQLSPKSKDWGRSRFGGLSIEEFLQGSKNNLALVYSNTSNQIREIAEMIYGEMPK